MARCPSQDWDKYVESQEDPFWDTLYEKFPWVQDLADSDVDAWPADLIRSEIESMVNWIRKESLTEGRENALADKAEYEEGKEEKPQ